MSEIDKRALVIDNGLFLPLAQRLTRDFAEVEYFAPWKCAAPRKRSFEVGCGYEAPNDSHLDALVRVPHLFDAIKRADVLIYPDVGDGDQQEFMREHGYKVWGCGRGEHLELDRWATRKLLRKLDMPVAKAILVTGLDDLTLILREDDDLYVKIATFRGDMETFHHETWIVTEPWLAVLRNRWGPKVSRQMEFIVEEPIVGEDGDPGIEIGLDSWLIDGEPPPMVSWGMEIKDASYVGKTCPYSAVPAALRYVQEKLHSVLARDYGPGFWSSEVKVIGKGRDQRFYLIDPCCRMGSPPGELYIELWSNLGEVIWGAVNDEVVAPVPTAAYGAELMLYSDFCDDHWTPISIPPGIRQWVKLQFATQDSDEAVEYVVPQYLEWRKVGGLVGLGDTLVEAIDTVRAIATEGGILSKDLESHPEALDEAEAVVAKGREHGIPFGDDNDAGSEPPPEE